MRRTACGPTRAGAIRRADVERGADDGHLILTDIPDVLAVGGLAERVDARERRLLTTREGRDGPILDRRRRLQPKVDTALSLLTLLVIGDVLQALLNLHPAQVLATEAIPVAVTVEHPHVAAPFWSL